MTPQDFIAALEQQHAEKTSGVLSNVIKGTVNQANKAVPAAKQMASQAANKIAPAAMTAAQRAQAQGASVLETAGRAAKAQGAQWANQAASGARAVAADPAGTASRLMEGAKSLPGRATSAVSDLGENVLNRTRKGLNYLDNEVRDGLNMPARVDGTGASLGNQLIGSRQLAAKRMSPVLGQNPLNLAAGVGTLGAGGAAAYGASGMFGGGSSPAAQQPMRQPMQQQGGNGGLMDMWNGLPLEARYAIGAGVPLALMGAFAGGNGNSGLGMGMGAAGLGLAGLGAAQGGMFGSGMQQGAQGIMNMISGRGGISGGQDPHYHAYLQGNLNNQLANNSVSSGMTKTQSAREFGAYIEKLSAGRCWDGYEPVPGKAPYSNDSCRPKGKKKKTEEKEKTAAKDCGCTAMTATPSSRGVTKKINDEQKSTNSPKPEDVGATQNSEKEAAGFLGAVARGIGAAGRGAAAGSKAVVTGAGRVTQGAGNMIAPAAAKLQAGGMGLAQRGMQQGGIAGTMKTLAGGAGAVTGGAANLAGQALQGTGGAVRALGKRTGTAVPAAAYGAYQLGQTSMAQPYVNAAQQFGSDTYNRASENVQAAGQGAMAAGRAVASVPHAVGDYAGATYGAGRNAVVNTARDVRQGARNAYNTATSYIPSVRSPFHYPGQPQ